MKIAILLVLALLAAAQELNEIRTYFGQLHSEFFLSIGRSPALSALVAHELKTWKGLYVLPDPAALHHALATDPHNQALLSNPSLSLAELCRSYFPKTPKLLILADSQTQSSVLASNNWSDSLCLPEVILVEGEGRIAEAQKLLAGKGYELLVSKGGVGTFGHSSQLGVINHRKTEFEVANRLGSTPIFIREQQLPALYEALLPGEPVTDAEMTRPTKLHLYQTHYRVVSLPDATADSQDRPTVVLNFLGKQNLLYLGTNNFTITDKTIGNLLFKLVRLGGSTRWQEVYVLLNDGSKWLQLLGVDGNVFYEKDSDYNNVLAYKNKCFHFQDAVKVVIRDNTYSYSIDPTTYGNLDRPLKARMHVSPIPEPQEQDLRPYIIGGVSALVLVSVAVGMVAKKRCKAKESYTNIKRDPANNEEETGENLP